MSAHRAAPSFSRSVSLRLYPHELPPERCIEELCDQASLAESSGFDGLMTSEHHGGFRGYLPNPLLVASFALAATESVWAGPCPMLLPLRHWTQTVEDLAWLAARYPGRVVSGFAAGGLDRDFEMAELPFDENLARFKQALPPVAAALRGEANGFLAEDPAVAALAQSPIPCLGAAMSPPASRRAAKLGLGLLCDSLQTPEGVRALVDAHREAGPHADGAPASVLIRRVWVGAPPREQVSEQKKFYEGYAAASAQKKWGSDELVSGETGEELADRLAKVANASGCGGLNLRVHVHGVGPEATREQIERVGREALPLLRDRLGWNSAARP